MSSRSLTASIRSAFCTVGGNHASVEMQSGEANAAKSAADKRPSMTYVDSSGTTEKSTEGNVSVDGVVSLSSDSSSYSVITLKDSPNEGRLSGHPKNVSVSVLQSHIQELDSSEQQHLVHNSRSPPHARALSAVTTAATVDTLTSCFSDGASMFVDRLERKLTVRNKAILKITEHSAVVYSYSPSFSCLPAIVESFTSDDMQLSDISVASGDGYIADVGHRSESSVASSPTVSLHDVVMSLQCSDVELVAGQRLFPRIKDKTHPPTASASGQHPLHLDGELFGMSAMSDGRTDMCDRQQLSAKSSSDGIDSAVGCTPYSSQTSQDSTSTVDNTHSGYCQPDTDDRALRPSPSAAAGTHPVKCSGEEMRQHIDVVADLDSLDRDSDDEVSSSVTSTKVDWEVGSDDEATRRAETNVICAPLTNPAAFSVQEPFPKTDSVVFRNFGEKTSEEAQRPSRCGDPAAKGTCCACMACTIMRRCVSTADDVTPSISLRLCSSVVDIVCLLQRLTVIASTWLQVLCDSAFQLEHSHYEWDDQEPAVMRQTSAGDDGSSRVNQHRSISEGLKNIQENLIQQLVDVSYIYLLSALFSGLSVILHVYHVP